MIGRVAVFGMCMCAGVVSAADILLPSGQNVVLYDVVLEEQGVARFLFLAPEIGPEGQGLVYGDVQNDFLKLCEDYALPALTQNEWQADEVVISMSSIEVAFGVIAPEATQFFEPFDIVNGFCLSGGF